MKEYFKNKVVLITGAAQGIGLATSQEFARVSATVIMSDVLDMTEQVKELTEQGFKVVPYKCDVSDENQVQKMIEDIATEYGRLDCAFNNAGVQTPQRPMAEITYEEFDKTVAVDFKGVWNCMKFEIEQMLKQGSEAGAEGTTHRGAIVNTSSQGGVMGFPGQAAYIACKHAVIGLTKTASLDYASKGIRINAVLPGVILTPMAKDLMIRNPDVEKELLRDIPKGRMGEPYEIAHTVMWLCSPYSTFVDGASISVDGGYSIH